VRALALALVTSCAVACGQGGGGKQSEEARSEKREASPACAEQLAPLRAEFEWLDAWSGFREPQHKLVQLSHSQRNAVPEHLVSLNVESVQFAGQSPYWISKHADARSLEMQLRIELKGPLAQLGQGSVALAIHPDEHWRVVRPTLKALAEGRGAVALLVDTAIPPTWQTPALEQALAGDSLSDVADRLSQKSAEVFADCPAAASAVRAGGKLVSYVDAIEACDCRVDLAASKDLLHAIAVPRLRPSTVEITVVTSGDGTAFEAEPDAKWSEVLPKLLAAPAPILLPDIPAEVPPPPPPPP